MRVNYPNFDFKALHFRLSLNNMPKTIWHFCVYDTTLSFAQAQYQSLWEGEERRIFRIMWQDTDRFMYALRARKNIVCFEFYPSIIFGSYQISDSIAVLNVQLCKHLYFDTSTRKYLRLAAGSLCMCTQKCSTHSTAQTWCDWLTNFLSYLRSLIKIPVNEQQNLRCKNMEIRFALAKQPGIRVRSSKWCNNEQRRVLRITKEWLQLERTTASRRSGPGARRCDSAVRRRVG